eukprot:Rmarinus@m.23026
MEEPSASILQTPATSHKVHLRSMKDFKYGQEELKQTLGPQYYSLLDDVISGKSLEITEDQVSKEERNVTLFEDVFPGQERPPQEWFQDKEWKKKWYCMSPQPTDPSVQSFDTWFKRYGRPSGDVKGIGNPSGFLTSFKDSGLYIGGVKSKTMTMRHGKIVK